MSFLYDHQGRRKYLTISERQAFLRSAGDADDDVHTFCAALAFTGARISEVLALTPERIDYANKFVVIESLKKRRGGVYRFVPVPPKFLGLLEGAYGLRRAQRNPKAAHTPVWAWGRTTAWKHVKQIMAESGNVGVHACPKGLRHSFGVTALQKGVPINILRKWLGHARLSTTAIYTDAIGDEERAIAAKFWRTF